MPSVVIAESDHAYARRLTDIVGASINGLDPADVVGSLEMALDEAERRSVDVVIVGPTFVGDMALELATYLSSSTKASTVFVASEIDADLLRSAMRAGVTDVVSLADVDTDPTSEVINGDRHASR